ncbi:MAG: hypothetical protein JKX78_03720 [Alteromonadaceae bacterium]|nr:hypothetical protein [Alteromonadaceae bacterium]MBL4909061.1 hypothetical protein [Alteromonadaceae bacterium]MBL4909127.1 hypothetical protein [Alteromonadaceae bacterium]
MATMGNKPDSKLEEISKSNKVKRDKLKVPIKLKKRRWLEPLVFFIKIWCILRGRGPSKATVNWLAKYGIKQTIGKVGAGNGEEKSK